MIELLDNGGYATIQGSPRIATQQYGIPKGGHMDMSSASLANRLVGNPEDLPVIELFSGYLRFRSECELQLSFTGAVGTLRIGERAFRTPCVLNVSKGEIVNVQGLVGGNILYIGVRGGFDVPKTFGSSSTYVPARIGPNDGRQLLRGDFIKVTKGPIEVGEAPIELSENAFPNNRTISVYKGAEYHLMRMESREVISSESYELTQLSRMGYRLQGPGVFCKTDESLTSRYVTRGTIQLPPGGQPIVLMSDAQVTGGYPRIAQVQEEQIDYLAQLKPGSRVRFSFKEMAD